MDQSYLCDFGCGRKFQDKEQLLEHNKRRHAPQQLPFLNKSELESVKNGVGKLRTMKMVLRPKLPQVQQAPVIPSTEEMEQIFRDSRIDFKNPPNPKAVARQQLMRDNLSHKKAPLIAKPPRSSSIQSKENVIQKPPVQVIIKRPTSSQIVTKKEEEIQNKQIEEMLQEYIAPTYTTTDLLESKKKLTKILFYQHGGQLELDKITHLILRQQELIVFESTKDVPFKELVQLRSLSLSHNKLINVIGISELWNIQELNINDNQITDLSPISQCRMLQRVWANNNSIERLSTVFAMIHLEILGVGNNKIKDFLDVQKFLKQTPSLKELEIKGNPCTLRHEYKYDIIWGSFLDKLDGQVITDQDYMLAMAFQDNKNPSQLSRSQILSRPQSAHYQENQDEELEPDQYEESQDQSQDFEEALQEAYFENHQLRERICKLEDLNQNLSREAEKIPYLETEVQELRNKVSAYETMLILRESPEAELRKEIYRLTQELAYYKKESQLSQYDENQMRETVSTFMFNQPKTQQKEEEEEEFVSEDDSDSNKYFQDDDNEAHTNSQELMELIMRNSMTLSQMKSDFRNLSK